MKEEELEELIRIKLKEIMMQEDLESVTCKYVSFPKKLYFDFPLHNIR